MSIFSLFNKKAKAIKRLKEKLSFIHLGAIQSVSDEMLDRFPDLLSTESLYDSVSVSYVGMVFYHCFWSKREGSLPIDFVGAFQMADRIHSGMKKMNRTSFVPMDFMEIANRLCSDVRNRAANLDERSAKYGIDSVKLLAWDIAEWIVTNLTNRTPVESDKECIECFAILIIKFAS